MWDICVDCTEEFVSNEVIRVVPPTTKEHEKEPFYYYYREFKSGILKIDLVIEFNSRVLETIHTLRVVN